MHSLSKTAKDILKNIFILGAVEIVLGVIFIVIFLNVSLVVPHILGIVMGTAMSGGRLIHLEKSINASLGLGDKDASGRHFRIQSFLRTIVTVGALGLAMWMHPFVNIVSVAIGLFNTPLGTGMYRAFNKNSSGSN